MVSSPTLNVVVLTMTFALLPFYLAMMKIVATLIFLLIIIPLLCRYVVREETLSTQKSPELDAAICPVNTIPTPEGKSTGWRAAFGWFVSSYLKNLWFIGRVSVPLMLLAALLGAVVVTLAPWESWMSQVYELSLADKLMRVGMIALFGLFLPVPIAFDVVICATLLAAGMPVREVMALLFTLGIYSVYSFAIIGRAVSWKVSIVLATAILVMAMGVSGSAHYFEKWKETRIERLYRESFSAYRVVSLAPESQPIGRNAEELLVELRTTTLEYLPYPVTGDPSITLTHRRFADKPSNPPPGFEHIAGSTLGIADIRPELRTFKYLPPNLQAIATGDVHNDGWPDVLLAEEQGLRLYANRQGQYFEPQAFHLPVLEGKRIASIALVDINNDGWLDLFISLLEGPYFLVINQAGRFSQDTVYPLPDLGPGFVLAPGFADLDRDGTLEIIIGKYAAGVGGLNLEISRNAVVHAHDSQWRLELLPALPAETMTTYLSDIDGDGTTDLLIGNDYQGPSVYYLGDHTSNFSQVKRTDNRFPYYVPSAMSIDSADIDNDLVSEIYIAQISSYGLSDNRKLSDRRFAALCDDALSEVWKKRCVSNMRAHRVMQISTWRANFDPLVCNDLPGETDRLDCLALKLYRKARRERNPEVCERLPARWSDIKLMCGFVDQKSVENHRGLMRLGPRRLNTNRNVLFKPSHDGAFSDHAGELGLDVAGWSWNAKFADLDNDEWQDLYVANGVYRRAGRESNQFFHNQKGETFLERTADFGLTQHLVTLAYSYVDLDNDGDLDIVAPPQDGPVSVFLNHTTGQAIAFSFDDARGNRAGIGNRVVIHYGADTARHQMREIKASGGYLSFDPQVAFFGLGEHDQVDRVEIRWSTGETNVLRGPFRAGAHYRIRRQ